MGIDNLTPEEQRRVNLANDMYVQACLLFEHCNSKGILVTMENPLVWLTDPFIKLQQTQTCA